jgi:hypothetical protein
VSRLYCREHGGWVREADAVFMGASPAISGPGVARYACVTCVRDRGLVPPPAPYTPTPAPVGFYR